MLEIVEVMIFTSQTIFCYVSCRAHASAIFREADFIHVLCPCNSFILIAMYEIELFVLYARR